jgi:Amt family ammonium transporter
VGFGIMFGGSLGGLIGTSNFLPDIGTDPWRAAFFVFQAVFVGTAATIDSGAVAERTRFAAYLVISFVTSTLIYPVFGHWAWGGLLSGEAQGWLELRGFVDFAGSTVVHSIGGWVALAGIIVVGPRLDRFDADGTPRRIAPNNLVLVYLGTFILFFGWFGFNAGSTLAAVPEIAGIVMNTILAAAFGAIAAGTLSWLFSSGKVPQAEMITNGLLGGLVAITAGCAVMQPGGAVLTGIGGGILVFLGATVLERLRLDDVVGGVPVHGFAGAWGTLAVALFGRLEALPAETHLVQLGLQALGVISAFLWAFPMGLLVFFLVKVTVGLRASEEDERMGLNMAEHGASNSLADLVNSISRITSRGVSEETPEVEVEHGTEIGDLSEYFNEMVAALKQQRRDTEEARKRRDAMLEQFRSAQEREKNLREQLEKTREEGNERLRLVSQQMRAAVDQLQSTLEQMQSSLHASNEQSETAERAFEEAAHRLEKLLSSMTDVRSTTARAGEQVEEAVKQVEAAAAEATALHEAGAEIRTIIQTINDIAEQTRLLSVNASIEAARAGQAGSGFGVVAGEIRSLAEDSSSSASEIEKLLDDIGDKAEKTSRSMQELRQRIQSLDSMHGEIGTSVDHQSETGKEVGDLVSQTAERIRYMAEALEQTVTKASTVGDQVKNSYDALDSTIERTAKEE